MQKNTTPYLPVNHVFVDLENVKGATADKGEMVVEELRKSGYLVIDDKGSVSYKP